MISSSLLTCDPTVMPNDPTVPNPITTSIGTVWTFQNANVTLTPVTGQNNIHATVVIAGQIGVTTTANPTSVTYNQGDIIDFVVGDGHQITSLVENTIIINIVKFGTSISTMQTQMQNLTNGLSAIISQLSSLETSNSGSSPTN